MLPEPEEIIKEYRRYSQLLINNSGKQCIDLSGVEFCYPTMLVPLGIHLIKNRATMIYPHNTNVANYIRTVTGQVPAGALNGRTYLGVERFPERKDDINKILKKIDGVCGNGDQIGGRSAYAYFIMELTDNVYDHSGFSNAFIAIQNYPTKGFIEIVIVDDGKSIPKNYEDHGIVRSDDTEFIKAALEGVSTKEDNLQKFNPGSGLRTSINLITKGLNGQVFLISRGAGILATSKDKESKIFKVPAANVYMGTLITIRIEYQKQIDYSSYIRT